MALAFYVPVFFGVRYITVLIISFAITDLIIGYHLGTHWTWGSVLIIGLISKFFAKNHMWRISGALVGACIFFIVTNLGVWLTGVHGLSIPGLVFSYTIAIPFLHTVFYQLYVSQ